MWMQSPGNKKWADLTAEDKNEVLTEPNALLRQKTNECESGNEYGFTICEIEIDGINYIIATNFHEGKFDGVDPDFDVPSGYSIVGTAHTHGKNSSGDHSSGDLHSIYTTINAVSSKNIDINNFTSVVVGTGKHPQDHILQIKDVGTFQKMGEKNYRSCFYGDNKYKFAGWNDIVQGNLTGWGLQFNTFPKHTREHRRPAIGGGR